MDLKLEYYGNITKKGYCIGYCGMYVPTDPNGYWDTAFNAQCVF